MMHTHALCCADVSISPYLTRFEFHLRLEFSGSSHSSNLNIGTSVATLPDAWRYILIGSSLGLVGPVSVYCDWMR